jgi:hypothetical protein
MNHREVGRWKCSKCGHVFVAAGPRAAKFSGFGAFMGPCPWDCGAWINRGFRAIRPGQVVVHRAEEWDKAREAALQAHGYSQ